MDRWYAPDIHHILQPRNGKSGGETGVYGTHLRRYDNAIHQPDMDIRTGEGYS
jgi:hypothetical protein